MLLLKVNASLKLKQKIDLIWSFNVSENAFKTGTFSGISRQVACCNAHSLSKLFNTMSIHYHIPI